MLKEGYMRSATAECFTLTELTLQPEGTGRVPQMGNGLNVGSGPWASVSLLDHRHTHIHTALTTSHSTHAILLILQS